MPRSHRTAFALATLLVLGPGLALGAPTHRATPRAAVGPAKSTAPDSTSHGVRAAREDSTMTLHGGQEGTVFKTLTVEGEDRVHIEFDRPTLDLDLDPAHVAGLDLGTARDVLDRTSPDLVTPLMQSSANQRSPWVAHPWLNRFGADAVARFHPELTDVARWKLVIANAKGQSVYSLGGQGNPPREITWDGRSSTGEPVVPGLTYSYVVEAYDRAGNKRNFVGQGFRVDAFRVTTPDGPALAFTGQLLATDPSSVASDQPAAIVIEAASWLNQSAATQKAVRVTATARSLDRANTLASQVTRQLASLTLGDPARIQPVAKVEPDAPEDGVVRIVPGARP